MHKSSRGRADRFWAASAAARAQQRLACACRSAGAAAAGTDCTGGWRPELACARGLHGRARQACPACARAGRHLQRCLEGCQGAVLVGLCDRPHRLHLQPCEEQKSVRLPAKRTGTCPPQLQPLCALLMGVWQVTRRISIAAAPAARRLPPSAAAPTETDVHSGGAQGRAVFPQARRLRLCPAARGRSSTAVRASRQSAPAYFRLAREEMMLGTSDESPVMILASSMHLSAWQRRRGLSGCSGPQTATCCLGSSA